MHLSTEAYDVFEQVFQGKDNAKKVMRALEEAIVTTVHDSWYRTKEELKAEVFSHFATKDDLELLRTELLGKMEKDKAELLGEMKKDKAELVGMITNVHTELTGKFEALYEKTEKDKAELSGKIEALYQKTERDKAELSGKIEALFAKTEKDKAELNEKIENVKSEMLLRFEKMDKKFSLFFALLLFAIIFLNQNALEFIAKVIGIMR